LTVHLKADECYRLEACGLSAKSEKWIDVLNQLTCRSDLQLLTLLPLKNVVSSYQLIHSTNRVCPKCYAEDECVGRAKYDRLLWTLCCVTACPKHRCKLVYEPRAKGSTPLPFTVPGISRIDGSSLAKLSSTKASKYEVELAGMVAELLEDMSRIGVQETSLLSAFLAHAADVLFDGNAAALALHLGLSKSQVHGWMRQGILASLSGVARIAYSFECTMLDVLLGNKAKLRLRQGRKLPHGLFRLTRRVGYTTPHEILQASLSKFMKGHPDACAQDAANYLEVSPNFFRKNFTVENDALVVAGRLHKQQISQARRDAKDEVYKKWHSSLAKDGVYPSRRKVMKRLKEMGICLSFGDMKRAKDKAHEASRIGKRGPWSISDKENLV
jgi:TniQ